MKKLELTEHDEKLAAEAKDAIDRAIWEADNPIAVAKRIAAVAVRQRNKGRGGARKRHPFKGICEVTGKPLRDQDKVLDEMEPEKGYQGRVRWTCPKCNNSGSQSCG